MRLEITIDASVLKDLFMAIGNDNERLNRVTRIKRHIIVTSNELQSEWEKGMKQYNLIDPYYDWLFGVINSKKSFKKIPLPTESKVQGQCDTKDHVVLSTSYESKSKIVVGDYNANLRRSNRQLKFVNKKCFSSNKRDIITMQMVDETLKDTILKKYLFDIFETPIYLCVNKNSSADLLAEYLSGFYDEEITIQDLYLINDDNENNFKKYILPHINKGNCKITLVISTKDGSNFKKKLLDTDYNGYQIAVKCGEKGDLHPGFIETSKFRINIGYRLAVFGQAAKRGCVQGNNQDFITIVSLQGS